MSQYQHESINDDALDDPRVREAVQEYQNLTEAGRRPDRDEFLAQYGSIAPILAECLDGLDFLHGIVADIDKEPSEPIASAAPVVPPVEEGQPLGDYRIVREIGRGGMGVVYEAVQLSLGRRVALKVLPFAAALDERQLQRFRNEAQAAAQLHHTHIVPVHGLGTDRGIHYYAMQYIEGYTLADVIGRLRHDRRGLIVKAAVPDSLYARARQRLPASGTSEPPTLVLPSSFSAINMELFRTVARLGAQAAEALEHAHQCGIIHRDIKPANLLLNSANHLWITDFGLARCRNDQGLTFTGDVVGTLRYMSPEQALARHGLVDHRTDIYSLGVTLYELLALEPAFPGQDRDEILRQIAWDEPQRLRRVNPAIPLALETTIHKAMAPEAERRYATAQELADDLRRFVDGQPIQATPPGVRERLGKWARRHRTLVASMAVALIVAVIGLVIGIAVVWQQKERTRTALAEAMEQRQRAETNFRQALEGVDNLLWQLEEPRWANMPRLPELRRELTRGALRYLQEKFIRVDSTDPAVRSESGRVYYLLAIVHCGLQEPTQAFEALQHAETLFDGLVAQYPEAPEYRKHLAAVYCIRGTLYFSTKQARLSEADYRRAIEQYRHLVDLTAEGDACNALAWMLAECPASSLRDPPQAVSLARKAVAADPTQARYWNTLGVAYYRTGQRSQAAETLQESMKRSAGGDPIDWFFLAMIHWSLGDHTQARTWFDKGERWVTTHPPRSDEWFRAGAEAAAMLGRKPPLPPGVKEPPASP